MQDDIIRRIHTALSSLRSWIDRCLNEHARQVRAVSSMGLKRLVFYFPQELLDRAKVVIAAHVPFPPVDRFGLPELAPMKKMVFAGITFKDTMFLQQARLSESLHFHELVHVVQWARLGVENFLLAYGAGLLQFGYERSPLEQMAYSLQQNFHSGKPLPELVPDIERRTDAIWTRSKGIIRAGNKG